jgi:hypothetical protein
MVGVDRCGQARISPVRLDRTGRSNWGQTQSEPAMDANQIAGQLDAVGQRVEAAARRAGRDPRGVLLLAASKTQPPAAIRAAYGAGARDFGENYVQEALSKRAVLADLKDLRWHLIGHLQTNKARLASDAFVLIQPGFDSPGRSAGQGPRRHADTGAGRGQSGRRGEQDRGGARAG